MKGNLLLLLLSAFGYAVSAQFLPAESSQLNHRIIGFSIPTPGKSASYKIEIAKGNLTSPVQIKSHLLKTAPVKNGRAVAEVPSFGCDYTWRVVDAANGKMQDGLHHFSTLSNSFVDTGNFRLTILEHAAKYTGGYVFNDGSRTLYDMKGAPVWFLPDIDGAVDNHSVIRDLKITRQHTITFLTFDMAYEINYDGDVLWRAPNDGRVSGDTIEYYHHELTRLLNGHYMVLSNDGTPMQTQMGTIVEYDKDKNAVWSWRASGYYKGERLEKLKGGPMGFKDPHMNAFFFDEKSKMIYVSFRNTSQVLKVKYPEGTVVNEYNGEELMNGPNNNLALFSEQHGLKVGSSGEIYLYNNNTANMYEGPNVVILRQPTTANGKLKELWRYTMPIEHQTYVRTPQTSGGNVAELAGGDVFVSACTPFSHVFIVSRDKKILWNAMLEKWDVREKKWQPSPQYRASFIRDRRELEGLLWPAASLPGRNTIQ